MLAGVLSQKAEIVHQVLVTSYKSFTQFGILGGYPHGAGVEMAFAHHHAAQYNEGAGGKTVLFGTEHGGDHDVAACFQLTVGL
ncbi:hypothetical protein SDC9_199056 [bioreactor metagenome]|uniref:Uncharacterized protein n=1 Tax=bioreactor metagenome TaxID=1076179 RepID=A0A645IJF0_9ZZZZ